MTKKPNTPEVSDVEETTERVRPQRRKTYTPVRETQLDQGLVDHFAKDGYAVKLIRWAIQGDEDDRYLARRQQEGYEFVSKDEVPAHFLKSMRIKDTRSAHGMLTMGDLCLMKVDQDLRQSRREHFRNQTENEIAAVDYHVMHKKGFHTAGSRSKVSLREPSFQE